MRILILTAGFGEGHNTAARCIAEAIREHEGAEAQVVDVYIQTIPTFTKVLQAGYGLAINKLPLVWSAIFALLDKPGNLEKTIPMAGNLRNSLEREIEGYHPDVIVSTYPLYAYLIAELRKRGHAPSQAPLLTMVTDSTAVNSSWYRAGSETFLVADSETAEILVKGGVPSEAIQTLGFPVTPRFSTLKPLDSVIHGANRILFLPSSKAGNAIATIRELQAIPNVEITVVTGRLEALHRAISLSGVIDGVRTHLVGWTDKVPELLCSHHLYIGKAGGAIVHEAMAARCPILVSHVVPGQEEGNIELIQRHDIGRLAAFLPKALATSVGEVFAEHGATWKRWKKNLAVISKPDASRDIARYILEVGARSNSTNGKSALPRTPR